MDPQGIVGGCFPPSWKNVRVRQMWIRNPRSKWMKHKYSMFETNSLKHHHVNMISLHIYDDTNKTNQFQSTT